MPESPSWFQFIIGSIVTLTVAVLGYLGLRTKTKPESPPITTSEPPPLLTKPRILVLDDNAPFTEIVRATLNGSFEVLAYTDAYLACDAFMAAKRYSAPIAYALLDLRLREMSGTDVAKVARIFQPQAKLVLMSGGEIDRASAELVDECWSPKHPLKERLEKLLGVKL